MIDLYYWPTPNGHKITMFLEEAGLDYVIKPVNISAGDQFKPEFLAISPNNRMPAIVDREPADGGEPVTVFESGAILLYLAEKTGRFLPADVRGRDGSHAVAVLADGRARADGRAEPPLQPIRAGEDALRDRALRQRDRPAVRRARRPARRPRRSSPASIPSPTWPPIRGSCRTSSRARTSPTSPMSSAGSPKSAPGPPSSAPTSAPTTSAPNPLSTKSRGPSSSARVGGGRRVSRQQAGRTDRDPPDADQVSPLMRARCLPAC